MSNKPLVTIGIINYNGLKFLGNCVEAYLNQSYSNVEIIVIDDCSTDGSIEYLKKLGESNENIRCIFHSTNSGGPSLAIQEIFMEAKGKYLQWLASDDYPDSKAIEKFVDFLEETDNDYVYCNFRIIDDNNSTLTNWNYKLPSLNELVYHIFKNCSGMIPMNGLYRTDFFRNKNISWLIYKGNDHSSDTINSMYFIKNGLRYGMINEALINYRLHSSNESHNIDKRLKTSLSVYDFIIQNFDEAIYLPQIKWEKEVNREEKKCYAIAQFYYCKIIDYIDLKGLPGHLKYSVTRDNVLDYLAGFINDGISYVKKGLGYENNLQDALKELEKDYKMLLLRKE